MHDDPMQDLQLRYELEIINERIARELEPLPAGGLPVQPKRKPLLPQPVRPTPEMRIMTTQEPISHELQAKIDALPDENLRANILRRLNRPWKRTKSNEQIFDEMLADHEEVIAERAMRDARLYRWREDEVIAFIGYFQEHNPQWYADYLHQERNGREIDADLAWNMRRLAEQWLPGLNWEDYGELFGMVRDYADAHLI